MNREQIEAASAEMWRCWREGDAIDTLPEPIRPMTPDQGYAVQARLEDRSDAPLYGWKIAATSLAGQQHINVPGPMAGRLLAERAFDDGATLSFGANRMRVIEPEFAFRLGRDLPPRDAAYSPEEAVEASEALHPAIEIPDSRFRVFTDAGAPQLIADNACAHEFVLGPEADDGWQRIDLAAHKVRAVVESAGMGAERIERDGVGAQVLGDPRVALAWLLTELSRLGVTARKGQIVTTGTCAVPLPITPGASVEADFGALGAVSCRFD